jgi:hypothetical protein
VGPRGYERWGRRGVGEKNITFFFFFAGTLSKLRFFWYFIALPPYPVPKTYDGWVRREGQGGSDLGEKSFQLSSLLTL